ncbi:MAG: response regulator transcription factor [Trueperaceae bacterium]|nr:response regulator transcription factor [Trueperaceae bacterium]
MTGHATVDRERILIVEDDQGLAAALDTELRRAYETEVAHTGHAALAAFAERPFDLVVLDLNLPDMDGIEVAEQLREHDTEILMLTARADVHSRVVGLYAGASDYMAKPFDMQELLARVYAQLRRRGRERVVTLGPLALSLADQVCMVNGEELPLTALEFRLLAILMGHPGRVFPKATIEERLYEDRVPSSNAVEVLVSRVRAKLEATGVGGVIVNVRGLGYVIRDLTR